MLGCGVSGVCIFFFFQAEDGIRDLVRSRGLGDVYKRQDTFDAITSDRPYRKARSAEDALKEINRMSGIQFLSLIHI